MTFPADLRRDPRFIAGLLLRLAALPLLGLPALGLLAADALLLLVLRRLHPGQEARVTGAYWLSPLLLALTYWAGATAVLPALLVTLSLALLREGRPRLSGAVMGLAIAVQPAMLALLPFLLIFLWSHRRHRDTLVDYAVPVAILAVLAPLFWTAPPLDPLLALSLGGQSLLVIGYLLLLYGAWQIGRMSFDLLSTVLGVALLALLLMTPTAIGGYVWVVPFLVGYQLRAGRKATALILGFAALFLLHALAGHRLPPAGAMVLHSAATALGAMVAVTMLRRGLAENAFFGLARKPLSIGIAGDSGTGKDTLALAIAGLFGKGAVTGISGDDYHLFERRGKLWQAFTHLDPRANDLEGFARDALSLLAWRPIMCRHYDHATGLFTPPRRIQASDLAIVSGLHALYPPALRAKLDVRVYLDMDEDLRRFFKIRRDVGERGHALDKVLASIDRRRADYDAYVAPQRLRADITFSLLPLDPAMLADITHQGPVPLRLRARLRGAIGAERLARLLIALCGAQVDLTLSHDQAELLIDAGDVQAEDIHFTAIQLMPDIAELLARDPGWKAGITGIMQLIVLLQLSTGRGAEA